MSNRWNIEGVPHRGWTLDNVHDVRGDGQRETDTSYETCMMCNNYPIRYVHALRHPEVDETFYVGCDCAEKMTNDYISPRRLERALRNKSSRRNLWLLKPWKYSKKGNYYLKKDGHILIIYQNDRTKKYKCVLDKTRGKKTFESLEDAKAALFEEMERLKHRGEW